MNAPFREKFQQENGSSSHQGQKVFKQLLSLSSKEQQCAIQLETADIKLSFDHFSALDFFGFWEILQKDCLVWTLQNLLVSTNYFRNFT